MAAGPLTVSSMRERVVDFTKPLWADHIVALMKKNHAEQRGIRSLEDLARQSDVKYGVIDSGATEALLRTSTHWTQAALQIM